MSPINNLEYNNYLEYLADPDISSSNYRYSRVEPAAKFHHSIIYTEVVDNTTKVNTTF